jgi:hypothetical protein
MQRGVCCCPIVRMRVFKVRVDKRIGVDQIVDNLRLNRTIEVAMTG